MRFAERAGCGPGVAVTALRFSLGFAALAIACCWPFLAGRGTMRLVCDGQAIEAPASTVRATPHGFVIHSGARVVVLDNCEVQP